MMRSAVDLPQPEGPSRLTNSPWPISSDMFCSATVPLEKTFDTPRRETSGSAAPAPSRQVGLRQYSGLR